MIMRRCQKVGGGWRDLMWVLMIFGFALTIMYILFFRDHPRHEFNEANSHESSIMSHLKQVMQKKDRRMQS